MKHSIALGITMLFLSGIAVGQELPENLISEQLEQGFYDLDNPESLIYEKKELYFYNGYGLKERSERYTRGSESNFRFIKTQETLYHYDFQQRLERIEEHSYDYPSGEKIETSIRLIKYSGNKIEEEKTSSHGLKDGYIYVDIKKYDETGNWLLWKEITTFHGEETFKTRAYEYDENGCLVLEVDTSWFDIRKSEYVVDQDCYQREARTYQYDESAKEYLLDKTWRNDRMTDDNGNTTYEANLRKIEGRDSTFLLISEFFYFYDELNRDTLLIYLYNDGNNPKEPIHGSKAFRRIDDSGNNVYAYNEEWHRLTAQWLPASEWFLSYDDRNNLIYTISFSKYDYNKNEFMSTSENSYEYNDNDQLIYHYNFKEDLSFDVPRIIETEEVKEYACDGRMLTSTFRDLISRNETRHTYSYFDQPPCEPLSDPELSISLFPNPAKDYIHLNIHQDVDKSQIQIFDVSGCLIRSFVYNTKDFYSVDISHLSPGFYLIQIYFGEKVHHKKFLKI